MSLCFPSFVVFFFGGAEGGMGIFVDEGFLKVAQPQEAAENRFSQEAGRSFPACRDRDARWQHSPSHGEEGGPWKTGGKKDEKGKEAVDV